MVLAAQDWSSLVEGIAGELGAAIPVATAAVGVVVAIYLAYRLLRAFYSQL